jgi:hypothetical protein
MTRWQTFEICFHSAGRVLLLQSSLKSHVTSKREYHKDKMAGLLYGLYFLFLADHRAKDFTLSKICGTAPRIRRTFQQ